MTDTNKGHHAHTDQNNKEQIGINETIICKTILHLSPSNRHQDFILQTNVLLQSNFVQGLLTFIIAPLRQHVCLSINFIL